MAGFLVLGDAAASPSMSATPAKEGTSSINKDEKRNFGNIIQDLDGLALSLAYFLTDLRHDTLCQTYSELYGVLRWLDEVPDICAEIPADSIWRSTSCKEGKAMSLEFPPPSWPWQRERVLSPCHEVIPW